MEARESWENGETGLTGTEGRDRRMAIEEMKVVAQKRGLKFTNNVCVPDLLKPFL